METEMQKAGSSYHFINGISICSVAHKTGYGRNHSPLECSANYLLLYNYKNVFIQTVNTYDITFLF